MPGYSPPSTWMNPLNKDKGNRIGELLEKGAAEGVYPGAVLLFAVKGRTMGHGRCGYLSLIPDKIPMEKDTVFDLASLTKPLATTMAVMKLVGDKGVDLDRPLSDLISFPLEDKKDLTLRLLLSHSAGLVDWRPFYLDLVNFRMEERKRILREWIIKEPFVYNPGEGCLYSDLGFMILEWIIEEIGETTLPLFMERHFFRPLSLKRTFLYQGTLPPGLKRENIAATEACVWRQRIIQGEVHDENAFALGGYSGHAGLFGTAKEILIMADMLREHYFGERDDFFKPRIVRDFFRRQEIVEDSTWALGWDTPSVAGSSSGKYFSSTSVGHLGFSGTSIWMDLQRDITVVFLTNRIHPDRNNRRIREFRPVLHDLIIDEVTENEERKARREEISIHD